MKNTMKRTLGFVLALALILTAIGCGVAYADSYRGERGKPVTVENPYKTPAAPVMEEPATPASEKPAVEVEKAPAVVEKPAPVKSEPAPSQEPLTVEQAKAIALEALALSDAHFTDVERDDGEYELELCDGNREYDVEVGIFSGKVREIDRDDDACDRCKRAAAEKAAPSQEPLTVEQAKAIALEALGLSSAHFTDVERDDGKYELELCDGNREYEVEIAVSSGKVLEIDRDDDACDHCDDDDDDWDDDWDDDDWDDDWDD